MRWLLIGLLISVAVLLYLAGAVTRHILRQRRATSPELLPEEKPVTDRIVTDPQAPQ